MGDRDSFYFGLYIIGELFLYSVYFSDFCLSYWLPTSSWYLFYPCGLSTNFDTVSVLTADQLTFRAYRSDFSPGQETAIVNNCANTHVWNDKNHFISYSPFPPGSRAVSTIGGQNHFPVGSGDVSVSWRDDDNVVFKHVLKNVLYFPDSPVKIITAHKLATEWGSEVDL